MSVFMDCRILLSLLLIPVSPGMVHAADEAQSRHQAMVEEVQDMARDTAMWTGRSRFSERVIAALHEVPRDEFVPDSQKQNAYLNRALGIGHGQTISQPYIVALMTDLAGIQPGDRVLEVGTGSGYQAAILAELTDQLYSIELLPELGQRAAETLRRLGYEDIQLRIGDGYQGWPEAAPFDAIIVTAAPGDVPESLIEQLAVGGRMVIPVGEQHQSQTLRLIEKGKDGQLESRDVIAVGFVPMVKPETGSDQDSD